MRAQVLDNHFTPSRQTYSFLLVTKSIVSTHLQIQITKRVFSCSYCNTLLSFLILYCNTKQCFLLPHSHYVSLLSKATRISGFEFCQVCRTLPSVHHYSSIVHISNLFNVILNFKIRDKSQAHTIRQKESLFNNFKLYFL